MFGIEEVTFHELHLLEQLQLSLRAKRDVRGQRFQKQILKPIGTGKDVSLSFMSSPFTVYEVQRYNSKRERYLGRKKHIFRVRNKRLGMRLSVAVFRNMLRSYEQIIGRLETQINIEIMRMDDNLENLLREKDRFDKQGQLHMSQLCINRAEKLRNEYYARNVEKYLCLKEMLNKKLSKYEAAETHLKDIRRRTLIRLAYYYFRASNLDPSLRHYDMSQEQLALVSDLNMMEEYHEEMEATARKIGKIDTEIAELNSWRV